MKCSNCGAALTSPTGISLTVCPFCHTDNSAKRQIAACKGEIDLRNEFLRRGQALYKDKRVLGAVISDYFAEDQRLLKGLRLAVQEDIASKIVEVLPYNVSEQKIRISAIISYFAGDYGMSESHVAGFVRVLAYGAGFGEEVLDWLADMANGEKPPPESWQIGNVQSFGGYNWRVLDIQNGQALLLSELILEKRPYHKEQVNITWENCTMRNYLNNKFYNKLPT